MDISPPEDDEAFLALDPLEVVEHVLAAENLAAEKLAIAIDPAAKPAPAAATEGAVNE
jgi:hypothetical protein